ncbi:MAG TPA: molybdate ABC transporter substrate-binding protein [Sulfurovum sp.]|nr:molybdate ABC transporter substrate-binding protein [Sulfurovum sp.]
MKKYIVLALWSFITLGATDITVAVAANVGYVIEPLIKAFHETHPNTKVNIILGSSGKLSAQIKYGAPFDLFMSANMKYPDVLYHENLAVSKPVVYARGALVLLSKKKRDYNESIYVLEDADIKKIAIANPQTAPYGEAAKEALVNAKLYEKLQHKLVYGESVSQTVNYITMLVDIGIIAKSSLFSPHMRHFQESKHWVELEESLYTPIDQGMVMLKSGESSTDVKTFYDFMLGAKAKEILKSFGYKVQ